MTPCPFIRPHLTFILLTSAGDDKSGCFGSFNLHMKPRLKEHHLFRLPILPYRGNRFNILFENASGVYFLHEEMVNFLKNFSPLNRLLQAVLHDLQVPQYVAGAKALGLVGKLVTSPLWCLLEDKTVHILDMNQHYTRLISFFQEACDAIEDFMAGKLVPFVDYVHQDAILDALTKPSTAEIDSLVQSILLVVLPALSATCQHLFKDHLSGGRWSSLDTQEEAIVREKTKSVPKSSKFAESVFGMLDHLFRAKPRISTITAEAYIMFANNHTMEWLKDQDDDALKSLLEESRKDSKELLRKFRARRAAIEEGQR